MLMALNDNYKVIGGDRVPVDRVVGRVFVRPLAWAAEPRPFRLRLPGLVSPAQAFYSNLF
jgi:hypothetical protein